MKLTTRSRAGRPSRVFVAPEAAGNVPPLPSGPTIRAPGVLAHAACFGLLAGFLEVGLLLATKPWRDPSPGLFRMNRHALWMIPSFDLALFAAIGAMIAPVALWKPRVARRSIAHASIFLGVLVVLLSFRSLHLLACLAVAAGASLRLGRWPAVLGSGMDRSVRWGLPVLAGAGGLLVALTLGRWSLAGPRAAVGKDGAPNVLLVVLDTVRADSLSLYGYGRPTSPRLEQLARRGVRFDRAWSTAPWTLPSHASMMTGRWPHELSADLYKPLDATYPTLAEHLASKGYATGGFVANTVYCDSSTGLARGFSHYEDQDLSPSGVLHNTALGVRVIEPAVAAISASASRRLRGNGKRTAETIRESAMRWIDGRDGQPFFAFLNFFDAHHPYVPPPGFDRHFGLSATTKADVKTLDKWFFADPLKRSDHERTLARDGYDDCIAYLDEQLGRLFEDLDRRGILDNTLVVVTADHGEGFGEHGLYGHGSSLYPSEVHVPLLIVGPGGVPAGRTVPRPASLRDLPATIVDLVGAADGSPFPGRSLARTWGGVDESESPFLSEVVAPVMAPPNQGRSPVFRGSLSAVVAEEKVYLRNGDGAEELYDLEADPGQMRDLSRDPGLADTVVRMRREMEGLGARPIPAAEAMRRAGGRLR